MKANKIYILDFGWLGGDIGWFLPGQLGGAMTYSNREPKREWVEIPITGAVVEHPEARILFDTGISPDAMKTHEKGLMEAFPIIKMGEENHIEKQLGLLGLKPEDIDFVVISHLHLDHVGQASVFRDAKVPLIVQRRELESALSMIWQGKSGAYDYSDLLPLKGARWMTLDDPVFEIVDGVSVEFTGGHTAGHQVMNVETEKGNRYTMTGDFLHLPREYEVEAKGWLLSDAQEWNSYIKKMKIREAARRQKLIISHDPGIWDKYPHAPKYVE
ncbi:N-acyl homoserine lactonase family protein [Thermoplasma sp. Kam2015]|nr:N-acyl homoserine lactonase family protein [Thermoplasma sp. Kam2015]